jgi:hypothetical protein
MIVVAPERKRLRRRARRALVAASGLTAAEVARRISAGETNDVPAQASRTVGQIVRANARPYSGSPMVAHPSKDGPAEPAARQRL